MKCNFIFSGSLMQKLFMFHFRVRFITRIYERTNFNCLAYTDNEVITFFFETIYKSCLDFWSFIIHPESYLSPSGLTAEVQLLLMHVCLTLLQLYISELSTMTQFGFLHKERKLVDCVSIQYNV